MRPVIVTGGGKWMSSDADMAKPPAGRGITSRYAMLRKTFAWRLEEAGVGHGAFLGLPPKEFEIHLRRRPETLLHARERHQEAGRALTDAFPPPCGGASFR